MYSIYIHYSLSCIVNSYVKISKHSEATNPKNLTSKYEKSRSVLFEKKKKMSEKYQEMADLMFWECGIDILL